MDLTHYFSKEVIKNKDFEEAFLIVKQNSNEGNIWVIGGTVYRNITLGLYGKKIEENYDFDFIIENPKNIEEIKLPYGWKLSKTEFGNPRFINKEKQIDFVPLNNSLNPYETNDIQKMSLIEKIESFFSRSPLNIQSIAFDIDNKKIVGDVGIKSIIDKKIKIYNSDECTNLCKRKGISKDEFLSKKANSLGFDFIL